MRGITLRQPLFNIPRIFEYTQHRVQADLGKAKFNAAESDLIIRTATVYFDLLAAWDKLEIVLAEKKAVAEQLEQAKRLLHAGAGTITDVHDALARYNALLSDEIEARNNININVKAFKRVTGVEPKDLCRLKETIPLFVPSPDDLEGWIQIAKENNPTIRYYNYNVNFYKQERRKMIAEYLPEVSFVADHHTSDTIEYYKTEEVTYTSVMAQITVPLFQGGYTRAKTKEATAKLEQAKADLNDVLTENAQKISEAFLGIKGNMAMIQALELAVQSAELSLQSTEMGLKAGIRTIVDVLDAQKQLYDEKMSLLKAKYEYIINFLTLKSEGGVLTEEDLVIINNWLQTT
jgi:outer membrane protein